MIWLLIVLWYVAVALWMRFLSSNSFMPAGMRRAFPEWVALFWLLSPALIPVFGLFKLFEGIGRLLTPR